MDTAGKIVLPPYARTVLDHLERAGFEAWCVGGCVRDSLLGQSPGDWDVTTSATPGEVKACFPHHRTVDTGIEHGTVAVVLDGALVEVTTFRSDGAYTDARHPDSVQFSRRLEDDLSRRDFTVNAMAYHPGRGLFDCFGGLDDLERRVLRCVGEPATRFSEDALRILRCLRFSSVLGFSIESRTHRAALEGGKMLRFVSQERIREELTKLLCGRNAAQVLRENSGLLFSVLPELTPMSLCAQETKYHCYNVWEHTLHALEAAPKEASVRWAVLLHDCGKPAKKIFSENGTAHFHGHAQESRRLAEQILKRLRFSNREREEICALIEAHGETLPLLEKRLKKLLGSMGAETVFRLFSVMRADLTGKEPSLFPARSKLIDQSEALAREILVRGDCLTLRDLAVNGNDLLQLGYLPGKALGNALGALLNGVLEGDYPNERAALLSQAEGMLQAGAGSTAGEGK